MIKRILVIFLCIAVLIVVLVVPASAAVFDYNDLITNVTVDGDNDLVTVSVPVSNNRFNIVDNTAGSRSTLFGNNISLSVVADHNYRFEIAPGFGDRVLLEGIPAGTLLRYTVSLDQSSWGFVDVTNISYSSDIYYLDADGVFAGSAHSAYLLEDAPAYVFLAPLDNIPSNGVSFYTFLNLLNFSFNDSRTVSLSVVSCQFEMSISSLYRLQQETGKNTELLKAVEQKLDEQGQTLDEVLGEQQDTNDKLDGIINDKVDPSLPSGGDIVGDLDDAEGQIRDDAQSGLDQGASVQQSAIQVLGQYLSAFACVSWIFDRFSTIPFVSGLLALSFSLGITGAILGIGLSIFNSYSSAERSRAARSARFSRSSRSKGG